MWNSIDCLTLLHNLAQLSAVILCTTVVIVGFLVWRAESENSSDFLKLHRRRAQLCALIFSAIVALAVFVTWKTSSRISVLQANEADDQKLRLETAEKSTRDLQTRLQEEQDRRQELETEVSAIRDYSYTARLNFMGLPSIRGGKNIEISSPLSKMMEGTFIEENGLISPQCGPEHEAKYLEVIEKFPDFPFTYLSLVNCLSARGDENWKIYAKKAIEILEKTTIIDGHHEAHDEALRGLLNYYDE